jgi:hypothetical protein
MLARFTVFKVCILAKVYQFVNKLLSRAALIQTNRSASLSPTRIIPDKWKKLPGSSEPGIGLRLPSFTYTGIRIPSLNGAISRCCQQIIDFQRFHFDWDPTVL